MAAYFDNLSKDPLWEQQYQRLLSDLKVLIEDNRAEPYRVSARNNLFHCRFCNAYEEWDNFGQRRVFDDQDICHSQQEFLLIDAKKRTYFARDSKLAVIVYSFICPVCGAWQSFILKQIPPN